jgi:hypothetical protein
MAQHGGKREGAGRKKGYAALQAEKAREILVQELMDSWQPIVVKAVEGALKGNPIDRAWLTDRGFGKALERLALEDPDDVLKSIIINRGTDGGGRPSS